MQARVQSTLTTVIQEPLFEAGQSPYLDRLLAAAPGARLDQENGASDARFLSAHGIPGVVWGADGDRSHHSAEEHVSIESISRLYAALETFIDKG
jgi:succinyl-diaminopimelate desuccinylase